MIDTRITVNTHELEQYLNQLVQKGKNLDPVMAEIANLLQNTVEEAFEQKADPVQGTPWQTLSPITIAAKAKRGYSVPSRPLYGDGTMQRSVNHRSSATQAIVGVNAMQRGYPYPAVHQFGTKDGKIPARRFLPVDDNGNLARHVEEEVLAIFADHFQTEP